MRVIAYVDALNLYHRGLKGTPHRWLNPILLVEQMLPRLLGLGQEATLCELKFFTAKVEPKSRNGVEDLDTPRRQKVYLDAIRVDPRVQVIMGFMQVTTKVRHLDVRRTKKMKWLLPCLDDDIEPRVHVRVIEEKGSDVSLGAHLVFDGCLGHYDAAIVISNDADLTEAVSLVTTQRKLPVVTLCPDPRGATKKLQDVSTQNVVLQKGDYASAQLMNPVAAGDVELWKPERWT